MTARRPAARELLTRTSEEILATVYPGQIRAVVIERALKRMVRADQRALHQAGEGRPS
jgi:hypothetical protein